jgi:hypothetical protein
MFCRLALLLCLGMILDGCSSSTANPGESAPSGTAVDGAAEATPEPVVGPSPSPDAAVEAAPEQMMPPPLPPGDAASSAETAAPPPDAATDSAEPVGPVLTYKDFTCSWVLGITTTGEWYRAGFENVVDNARWQVTPIEMGHLEKWADPNNPIWNSAIQSPCTMNSKTPDRIVYTAVKYEWTTVDQFLPAYIAVINNIKTKYPSVKRVDLMTYERAPGDMECAGANRPLDSWIRPVQDQAAAMTAAMFPGFVFILPKWEVKSCADFGLCPHLSGAANALEAKTIGEYFLAN